jgi:hypothetical protein
LAASVNRFSWVAYQGGSAIAGVESEYGAIGGQFAELTTLWQTYRLNAVRVEFIPNNTGSGSQSATLHAVDPAGDYRPLVVQSGDITDSITGYSRLRGS